MLLDDISKNNRDAIISLPHVFKCCCFLPLYSSRQSAETKMRTLIVFSSLLSLQPADDLIYILYHLEGDHFHLSSPRVTDVNHPIDHN